MNYSLNISKWVKQYIASTLRKPIRVGIAIALVSGIKFFYNDFNAFRAFVYLRISYNSQQRSLAYLLNKVFGTGTQIKVRTLSDTTTQNYLYGELAVPIGAERFYLSSTTPVYLTTASNSQQGEIICPASMMGREGEIRAWVDLVIFAEMNYRIVFI